MSTVVVSDTSCLIILDKIGHLPLLKASYEKVLVTPNIVCNMGRNANFSKNRCILVDKKLNRDVSHRIAK